MADFKIKYPSTDTVAITCSIASLASSTVWAGRASTSVDNTSNLDLDHLVSGIITLGTTPTASKTISVFAYAPIKVALGVPTFPDGITGTDANKTMTSANVGISSLVWLWTSITDSTTGRAYYMPPRSIAMAFGGQLPSHWGIFVTHDSVATLDSTVGNHYFHYHRIQGQSI